MALNTLKITNGKLIIKVNPDMIPRAQQRAMQIAKDIQQYGKEGYNCTPQQIIEATNKLITLVENIMNNYPRFNIFEYLPLTKAGNFAQNANILLADSGISDSRNQDYFAQKRLQLKAKASIEIDYDNIQDISNWQEHAILDNILSLEIELAAPSKKAPIFDKNGIPTQPSTEKTTYLKNNEIVPGSVYMEKGGSEYLYIGYASSWSDSAISEPTAEAEVARDLINEANKEMLDDKANGFIKYSYIRFTKKYQALASKCNTWQQFMDEIFRQNVAKNEYPDHGFSSRETPRKFVSKTKTLYTDTSYKTTAFKYDKQIPDGPTRMTTRIYVAAILS